MAWWHQYLKVAHLYISSSSCSISTVRACVHWTSKEELEFPQTKKFFFYCFYMKTILFIHLYIYTFFSPKLPWKSLELHQLCVVVTMAKTLCCERMGMRKGPWSAEEDHILISHIQTHGHANWRALPKQAG